MPKFVVCYKATSSVDIWANTAEEAKDIFDCWSEDDLMEELSGKSIEMTEIFEEEE